MLVPYQDWLRSDNTWFLINAARLLEVYLADARNEGCDERAFLDKLRAHLAEQGVPEFAQYALPWDRPDMIDVDSNGLVNTNPCFPA